MDRYSRNILAIGDAGQRQLNNSSVLVCGLGGLGSGVIAALAGFGIGKIGLVDFDTVQPSNLNRQFIHAAGGKARIGELKTESAREFLKGFETMAVVQNCRVEEADLSEYNVIVDCLDNMESKFFLSRNAAVPLVHGGVEGFFGQVCSIYDSACLDCFLPPPEISTEHTTSRPAASLSSVVNLISSIQATECLKILLDGVDGDYNTTDNVILYNKLLRVNTQNWEFKISNLNKNPNCKYCSGR